MSGRRPYPGNQGDTQPTALRFGHRDGALCAECEAGDYPETRASVHFTDKYGNDADLCADHWDLYGDEYEDGGRACFDDGPQEVCTGDPLSGFGAGTRVFRG